MQKLESIDPSIEVNNLGESDFIIAYNQLKGRAFDVCKRAKNKGVQVIELADEE